MKPDTQVVLGGVILDGFATPESLPLGGAQRLGVQNLVGGKRVIDALGSIPRDLAWSGYFIGRNANARAEAIDAMRKAGKAVKLAWADKAFTVVIESFSPDYQNKALIPYSINCIPAEESASPANAAPVSVNAMMKQDAANAYQRAAATGIESLRSAVASVRAGVARVSNFVAATREQISAVLAPIEAARAIVGELVVDLSNVGGVDLISLGAGGVDEFAETVRVAQSDGALLTDLLELDGTLGRMVRNLDEVGSAGVVVTQAGGDLYRLAVEQYGDATAWADIARANDLVDPMLAGVVELRLPASLRGSDGVR